MAYTKLQANTAINVAISNNYDIPSPASQVVSGAVDAFATASVLEDSTVDFIAKGVEVGDIVYNTTSATAPTVSVVRTVAANTLTLADSILSAVGNTYRIFRPQENRGCVLYVGVGGNLKILTAGNDIVQLTGVLAGSYVPIQVKRVFDVSGTVTDVVGLW